MLNRHRQSGVMLLEALIGVLLFSVGLIAMMGLQANALATVNETKFRSEAAFIAEQFISDIRNDSAYATTVDPLAYPPLFPAATLADTSPYTINTNTFPNEKTTTPPTAPAASAAVSMKQAYLDEKTDYTTNRFYFATMDLPGAENYAPIVDVTPCLRSAWDPATANTNMCPGPTNGILGVELYGAVVEIEIQWKLPTAGPTAEPRKYRTVAYIMLESTP